MNTVTPLLTDLTMMSAMRIAEHGRTVARVTAEVALSKVTGEYLAGFAHDLNRFERVEFTLTAATPPPLHNSSTEGVNRPF